MTVKLRHLTYDQAESAYRYGTLTNLEWDAYRWLWYNSAPRFTESLERNQFTVPAKGK